MPFNVTQKKLIEVEERNGHFNLMQCYVNQAGALKPEFCKRKNFESGEMDDVKPLALYLGKDVATVRALGEYLIGYCDNAQAGRQQFPEQNPDQFPDDDVPF